MPAIASFLLIPVLLTATADAQRKDCATPAPEAARAEITRLNEQYVQAFLTSDAAWYDRHIAQDYLVVLSSGRTVGRAEFLKLAAGPSGVNGMRMENPVVRVFGDTAQVMADTPFERTDGTPGLNRYIDTYHWMDCRWQVISAQITPVLPPKPAAQ